MTKKMIKSLAFMMPLASFYSFADTDIFTALDDPATAKSDFEGNVFWGYNAQSGNTRKSNLSSSTTLTWFQKTNAYSIWGEAANNSADDRRNSEKYQAGARARHNLNDDNYLFTQGNWLSDRYNGYHSRNTLTGGYGRQVLKGPIHNLRLEAGPGIRHDEYYGCGRSTKALAYGAASYAYQLTDNTKFIQGVSILATGEATINSETGLNVDVSKYLSLKLAYNITWNESPPKSAPKHMDTKTSLSLVYRM